MSAPFTPGPWEWWDDGESLVRVTEAAEQKLIAETVLPSNARLIAAAPDMLEALDDAIEFMESVDPGSFTLRDAREVVAKARGDQ